MVSFMKSLAPIVSERFVSSDGNAMPTQAGSLHDPNSEDDMTTTQLTIYSTQWCGYCQRLKAQLDRAGVPFAEIDIERDETAAVFVASVNGGNLTVPTVVLPSGAALTNPSVARVLEALAV